MIDSKSDSTEVTVIMDFGVDELDEYNEVVGRIDKATFKSSEVKPIRGNRIEVFSAEFSGTYVLGKKLKSNGYVEAREIVRTTD